MSSKKQTKLSMDNLYKDTKPFITLYLDVRRKRKTDGTYPLRVRIKLGAKTRYFGTGLFYSKESYEKITKGRRLTTPELNEKEIINAILKRAKIAASDPFSFEKFQRAWHNKGGKADVFVIYDEIIKTRREFGKFSTADTYLNSLNVLRRFHGGQTLPFEFVTPNFLAKFDAWMQTEDGAKSEATVSIYLRCLRSVFNIARSEQETQAYPFYNQTINPHGYKIVKSKKSKIPLTDQELDKIKSYSPTINEAFWYDMFMLSFYLAGMNLKDMALIENKQLINDKINYTRAKTRSANPNEHSITIEHDGAKVIINRWKTQGKYLLPLIEDNMTPEQIHKVVKFKVRNINKVMKSIAKKLAINTPISTYTARHTAASKLARSMVPIHRISNLLQHSDLRTTQIYLASFPDDEMKEYLKLL